MAARKGWCLAFLVVTLVGCGSEGGSAGGEIPRGDVLVSAGEFVMGTDSGEWYIQDNQKPAHTVYLNAFRIDVTEVTVAAYRECVEAGACSEPGTWEDCNWDLSGRSDHPVNCLEWNKAQEFCEWAGKRLPTEAEWEKAARGTDQRTYPWGRDLATCDYAVMYDLDESEETGCGKGTTWPVASKPFGASPHGALDMAGNVNEWVADYYSNSPAENPQGPAWALGGLRVVRGGAHFDDEISTQAIYRAGDFPDGAGGGVGFRCATGAE